MALDDRGADGFALQWVTFDGDVEPRLGAVQLLSLVSLLGGGVNPNPPKWQS